MTRRQKREIKVTKQMLGIPTSAKDARGFEAESAVHQALEILQTEGMILTFTRVMKFSGDDMKGIDFWVSLSGPRRFPVQVKSYFNQEEIITYLERKIWVIILPLFDKDGNKKLYSLVEKEARKAVRKVIKDFQFGEEPGAIKVEKETAKRIETMIMAEAVGTAGEEITGAKEVTAPVPALASPIPLSVPKRVPVWFRRLLRRKEKMV